MATAMDYTISTENRFAPVNDLPGNKENGGDFIQVRGKRKFVESSPCDKQTFSERTVDEKLNLIYNEIQHVKDSQSTAQKGMTLLFDKQEKMGQSMKGVYSATNNNIDMLKLLSYKSIDLEARSRRSNLIFRNISYSRGDNCFDLVRDFLCTSLELDGDNTYMERAHLFGSSNRRDSGRRDIIVCFRDFHDTTLIMNRVGCLRNTPYFIDRDYPNEIVDARKRLWGRFKAAKAESRQSGARVQLQYPAKIVVNGQVAYDEFPNWNDIMRGSRDRSFRHIHYEANASDRPLPHSSTNIGPSSQIPPSYPRDMNVQLVRPDVSYSDAVQSRQGAPITSHAYMNSDRQLNVNNGVTYIPAFPSPVPTARYFPPEPSQTEREVHEVPTGHVETALSNNSQSAPVRTPQTEALELTTTRTAHQSTTRDPVPTREYTPNVSSGSRVITSNTVPLVQQQPSIFPRSTSSNVPSADMQSDDLQAGSHTAVPIVTSSRNSREPTRRARSPTRRSSNTNNRSQSTARAARSRPTNTRGQRSDSVDLRRNLLEDNSPVIHVIDTE